METSQFSLFSGGNGAVASQVLGQRGPNYRLSGDRELAKGWRARASDNIAAIALAHQIASEARPASTAEQDRLIKFTGFGASALSQGLFPVNDVFPEGWEALGTELHSIVPDDEMPTMKSVTQYAHFTPEYIVRAVWRGAMRLGYQGGTAIEPGCGSGLFIAMVPDAVAETTTFVGVERDHATARIAKLLYPSATIVRGDYTDRSLPLPGGPYHLAIGNPPFSDVRINDGGARMSLHSYFISRAMRSLRPGGVGAFVCSRYLMDSQDIEARQRIAQHSDLVAAIRLPEGSMRSEAGTDVVVDLLFFKRRDTAVDEAGKAIWAAPSWLELTGVPAAFGATATTVNEYFARHPDMVLGEHGAASDRFGKVSYTCRLPVGGLTLADRLPTAISAIPSCPPLAWQPDAPAADEPSPIDMAGVPYAREGSYFLISAGSAIGQIQRGRPVLIPMRTKGESGLTRVQARLIADLIPLRDYARQIIEAQSTDKPWQEIQRKMRIAYRRFTDNHGPVNKTEIVTRTRKIPVEETDENTGEITTRYEDKEYIYFRRPNLTPFNADPDVALVASIEDYDGDTGIAVPGPIFLRRVIGQIPERQIKSAADAMAVCLDQRGLVDPAHIAGLLGSTADDVISELGDMIYRNPETDRWETADSYLSGAVRTKLAVAEASAATDPTYERNVVALRMVQPADLKPADVSVSLGMPLVPVAIVEQFCKEVLGVDYPNVVHLPEATMWTVSGSGFRYIRGASPFGTHRRDPGRILQDALNMRIPRIYDTDYVDGKKIQVFNPAETEAAKDKLQHMQATFRDWIWQDERRAKSLIKVYNARFNNLVDRAFDGSHQTFPGLSWAVTPYKHQKDVVWRIISRGSTYMAHGVGAGKTLAMILAIMEQRRLGLVKKVMVVVPSHTLAQWAREFVQNYPNCRILVADDTNFEKADRKEFMARAASNDWDAVIITHSAFTHLSAPRDFEQQMVEEEIDAHVSMIAQMKESSAGENLIARKRLENAKEKLQRKYEALKLAKDDLLDISQMGVDQIVYDEAQACRKLTTRTNMTLKGIDPDGSARAWDLFVKTRYTESVNPGRGIILASGTPIVNTVGEMHALLRFMNPAALESRGVMGFDAWAATFTKPETTLELGAGGDYKPQTRLAVFTNLPELCAMFRECSDVVSGKQLADLVKLPLVRGGGKQMEKAEPSDTFKRGQKWLAKRIKAIEKRRGKPKKGADIILTVINDGRHLAIDCRLIHPNLPAETNNKLAKLIENVHGIWQETASHRYTHPVTRQPYLLPGAAQMVFSDLGTLSIESVRGFSAYREIKARLIELGIPANEIAFMQDYKRPSEKLRLFGDVNAGRVRILIGSSETMGTGVNVQARLKALHHLDVPWLPSHIEQREGRIVRQGNQNEQVYLISYATLTSLDAQMWQTNERKARFIAAALSGDKSVRETDDVDEPADRFAIAKAMASGDDRLMRLAGLTSNVARMGRLRDSHFNEQYSVRSEINYLERKTKSLADYIPFIEQDIAKRVSTTADAFSMTFVGNEEPIKERVNAGQLLISKLNTGRTERLEGRHLIGSLGGFDVVVVGHLESPEELFARTGKKVKSLSGDDEWYTLSLKMARSDGDHGIPYGGADAVSLIRRLEQNYIGLDTDLWNHKTDLEMLTGKLNRLLAREGAVWPYEAELAAAAIELHELEVELAKNRPAEDDEDGEDDDDIAA